MWKECIVIVEKILSVLWYRYANINPREQYGIRYNNPSGLLRDDSTCSPPNTSPDVNIYIYLLLVISFILFLNINSSVIGAYIINWKAIYSGYELIKLRTASSFWANCPFVNIRLNS